MAALWCALLGLSHPAWAQPAVQGTPAAPAASAPQTDAAQAYDTALRAQRQGQPAAALSGVEAALRDHPNDLRLGFLRGVLLSEQGRANDAEAAFKALTEAFPELPEPYNNLAVLRAARGDLHGARTALEAAIQAAPNYAMAHENLGDLAVQMAQSAYQRAQQLDPQRLVLSQKLNLLGQILKPATLPPPVSFTPRLGAQPQANPE